MARFARVVSPALGARSLFAVGLGVRLIGLALIWAGDGSAALWRRALVVLGVILSIGGIAVLRYLLLSGPLTRLGARWRARSRAAWRGAVPHDRAPDGAVSGERSSFNARDTPSVGGCDNTTS